MKALAGVFAALLIASLPLCGISPKAQLCHSRDNIIISCYKTALNPDGFAQSDRHRLPREMGMM